MVMNGAQIITGILEREGITTVSGIPGGANLPMYDALGQSTIRHVLVRHEQAAGFIAQGMARRTGDPAVCFATSGPGVTNLLTAIADAKLDSVPVIAICGQVPSALIGTDAFQEIDTFGLSLPISKHSVLIRSANELLVELPKAFRIARSGRPGPLVIDVPKDVQTQLVEFDQWPEAGQHDIIPLPDNQALHSAAQMIAEARRPLIYAGAGCADSNSSISMLIAFAHKAHIPVTLTLRALGAFHHDDPLYLGMLGMHGTRAANQAIAESDLLIVLGARFDDRATGKLAAFAPKAKIIHIDLDAAELGKLRNPAIAIKADTATALHILTETYMGTRRPEWEQRVTELKELDISVRQVEESHPVRQLADMMDLLPEDAVITTDVGQHQMWAAQAFQLFGARRFLTSAGLGTMGFGLPAAIGAALADPSSPVFCISGDGSLLMNIQELATLSETRANVKILLLDNSSLGLVRQQQELFYHKHYVAVDFTCHPDFSSLAAAFGISSMDMEKLAVSPCAFAEYLASPGPALIRIPVNSSAAVYPMVPPGAANEESIGSYVTSEKCEYLVS